MKRLSVCCAFLILTGCENSPYDLLELHRVHVMACAPHSHSTTWNGDIWATSKETGQIPQRYLWGDPQEFGQPLCGVWNRYTYWDITFRVYETTDNKGIRKQTVEVMSMRGTE